MRPRLLAAVLLLAAIASLAWAIRSDRIHIPDRFAPWAPLRIDEEPSFLTRYKLSRLTGDADACDRFLATAGMKYEPLPDRQTGENCGLYHAVRIVHTTAKVRPFAFSCRAAVSLALWERHALQPAARRIFGAEVAELEHFGSYSCRNVYGRAEGNRSQHATAEALDVAGFKLTDGRRIRVVNDWSGDSSEGRFLHDVRDGACRVFDAVLSPDYNAAHRDHLHLDRGPYRICR